MPDLDKSSNGFLTGILLGVILVWAPGLAAVAGEAAAEDSPATGELHIEGGSVTGLTLEDEQEKRNHFSASGPVITLPPGKYRLFEVALEGGYTCWPRLMPQELWQWITVAPGQVARLRVGAPLRQVVEIRRQGPAMVLNYELIGQGGERYAPDDTSEPPTFAVYKGEHKVASGDFEFG